METVEDLARQAVSNALYDLGADLERLQWSTRRPSGTADAAIDLEQLDEHGRGSRLSIRVTIGAAGHPTVSHILRRTGGGVQAQAPEARGQRRIEPTGDPERDKQTISAAVRDAVTQALGL